MPVNPGLRVIEPIPADAEACPKCGGTTGYSGHLTTVMKVFGLWGQEDADGNGIDSQEYSEMRRDDCGAVFDFPPLQSRDSK